MRWGRIPGRAYPALERLLRHGFHKIPVHPSRIVRPGVYDIAQNPFFTKLLSRGKDYSVQRPLRGPVGQV